MTGRLLALAVLVIPAVAAAGESCTKCHTDESALKALFVPPKTGGGEGEG
jgi:hypothetical protein